MLGWFLVLEKSEFFLIKIAIDRLVFALRQRDVDFIKPREFESAPIDHFLGETTRGGVCIYLWIVINEVVDSKLL